MRGSIRLLFVWQYWRGIARQKRPYFTRIQVNVFSVGYYMGHGACQSPLLLTCWERLRFREALPNLLLIPKSLKLLAEISNNAVNR